MPLEVFSDPDDLYIPDPDHPVFLDWVSTELLILYGASKFLSPGPSTGQTNSSADHSAHDVRPHEHPVLLQLLVATMEPAGVLTHPHWLASRPDLKDLCMSSVNIQRCVKEISMLSPPPIQSCCIARL
ncbi:hypothetical protein DFH08DRAFT_970890 [Mycena albidolilacea]|uniref:Uncharacterized protein n=1 Tax=Mycena albidolilacea TaxID=1033008 RepID=A0AAD6ZEC6_9AGAR|nr:hypothetical protein DFH08DRAFT_970890 [Mycena albidolilacea]